MVTVVSIDLPRAKEGVALLAPQEAPSPANPRATGLDRATLTDAKPHGQGLLIGRLASRQHVPDRLCLSGDNGVVQLVDEYVDPPSDVVTDLAYVFERLAFRIGQLPADVALARNDGAGGVAGRDD